MIRTVAEMLSELSSREAALLDKSPVTHAPTIGDMYEGLAAEVLGRAIPDGLGLQIVTGFITDGTGRMSGQIDCMLVRGTGTPVPRTDAWVWHVKDVVSILEIKKRLYQADLDDAVDHLSQVRDLSRSYLAAARHDPGGFDVNPARRAYAQMTGRAAPDPSDRAAMPFPERLLLEVLTLEQVTPVMIVLGYHGYTTEKAFREAFAKTLERRVGRQGFGAGSLPQLLVSAGTSIVKANGNPYVAPLNDEGGWPLFFSSGENPLLFLLELVWTRLDQTYGLGNPWGDDLTVETPNTLLIAHRVQQSGRQGWAFETVPATQAQLEGTPGTAPWTPTSVSPAQAAIINVLSIGDHVATHDPDFLDVARTNGLDANELTRSLLATRLVALQGDHLVLTTLACQVEFINGEYYAADNNTGRLTRWAARRRTDSTD